MEQPTPLSSRSHWRIIAGVVVGNLVVAALLISATLSSLAQSRRVEVERAREAADNLAHSLSIEVASELRLIDNALTTVALRHGRGGAGTPLRDLAAAVQEQAPLLGFAHAMHATDALGTVVAGLAPGQAPFSVAEREYFAAAHAARAAIVSEPLVDSVLGGWGIVVARRLDRDGAGFDGVVFVALSARHFQELFQRMSFGASGAISLRSDSLRLAARHSAAEPASTKGLGSEDVSAELRGAISVRRDAGWYMTPTALDSVERITAYRRVPGYPYLVLAGFSTASSLAPWAAVARRQWAWTALAIALVALGSTALLWQHRRQHAVAVYASQLAREQNLLLDNDLVGMLRVRHRHIVWANKAVYRVLGYADGALVGQSTRMLYPDDATYEAVGRAGYRGGAGGLRYRAQVRLLTATGAARWFDFSGAAITDTESIWMMADIDQLKHSEENARHLALHDPLTGLANRRLFEQQIQRCLAQAWRSSTAVAVCYMDLDGFKVVNDVHGHEAGDAVLREVARRLQRELRANDTLARLGGDEFAWIVADVASAAEAQPVLERCRQAVQQTMDLPGVGQVQIDCSIGVIVSDAGNGSSWRDLLAAADLAMYREKQARRAASVNRPATTDASP